MAKGGTKSKARKGEGDVADRTRNNGNKRGISALKSGFVPPAAAKAKSGVDQPKPGSDLASSAGAKEGKASSSPSPSKKKKRRQQSKSPAIDADAMKKLLATTNLITSPNKQLEFQQIVKDVLSGRQNFSPASSIASTPTASPAPTLPTKKHQKKAKEKAAPATSVAAFDAVVLEDTGTPAAVSSSSSVKAKSGSLSKGKHPPRKGNLNHQRLKDCQRVVMTAVGTAVLTDHGTLSKADQDKTALRLYHGLKGLNKHPEIHQEKHLDHDDATGRPVEWASHAQMFLDGHDIFAGFWVKKTLPGGVERLEMHPDLLIGNFAGISFVSGRDIDLNFLCRKGFRNEGSFLSGNTIMKSFEEARPRLREYMQYCQLCPGVEVRLLSLSLSFNLYLYLYLYLCCLYLYLHLYLSTLQCLF